MDIENWRPRERGKVSPSSNSCVGFSYVVRPATLLTSPPGEKTGMGILLL